MRTAAQALNEEQANDDRLITEWRLAGGKPKNRNQVEYASPLYWALYRDDQRKKLAKREAKKGKLVTVTDLNLFTLAELVADNGGHVRFPNQIDATQRNGIKRCVDGGYLRIVGKDLVLTPAGKTAVADYLIMEIDKENRRPAKDDYYGPKQAAKLAKFEHAVATLGSERAT